MHFVTKRVSPVGVVGRHDEPFRYELLKDGSFVRPEVDEGRSQSTAISRSVRSSGIACSSVRLSIYGRLVAAVRPALQHLGILTQQVAAVRPARLPGGENGPGHG